MTHLLLAGWCGVAFEASARRAWCAGESQGVTGVGGGWSLGRMSHMLWESAMFRMHDRGMESARMARFS